MSIYRVYLTVYRGSLLPPFYIGSSSQRRLDSGYRGSVKSARYKETWQKELRDNPHLFKTVVVGRKYPTREEATAAERRLQLALNVVKSEMYINQSIAAKNGCFGRDVSGALHPLYGRGHTAEARRNISTNHADCSGSKNSMAKTFVLISPHGEKYEVTGEFRKKCAELGLPYGSALFLKDGRRFTRGPCAGWTVQRL